MVSGVETPDRIDFEDSVQAETSVAERRGLLWWVHRLAPARLTSRIVLLNLAGLVVLVTGILYFNQFRQGLIDARVESLLPQAHIIAAAVAGSATVDTGSIVIDPDALIYSGDDAVPDADRLRDLDFPINPENAGPLLRRLLANTTIRARIIDPDGNLIVDSRYLYGRGEILRSDLPPLDGTTEGWLERTWQRFMDWLFSSDYPLQKDYGLDNGKEFPEVAAALNGASVSVVRINERGAVIVLVAVPIQRFKAVLGTLVLSTTGGEIDNVIRAERQIVLYTFAFVALVTILLSILIAGTIAEPIRRLAAAAERVRRGINKRVEIPDFTQRRDEVGHLSGALRDMTTALYNRIDAIEAFAADVSHELKNPLTSLRSAVETLPFAKTTDQRDHLVEIVKDDVRRLDRLITDIADASRLDAELARVEAKPVDVGILLETMVNIANEIRKPHQAEIKLEIQPPPGDIPRDKAFIVLGHDNRLGQVIRNLIDNARSFTREGTIVRVRVRRMQDDVEIRVEDEGPGIRPDNLIRIFERFYTDRPEGSFGKNSGLGLSISKQIVEAHRGRIWAENRYGRAPQGETERPVLGARFIVRIPALPEDWTAPDES
ncbi:MAG: sensor histidine kinase [Rhizobiales bacterium]|nr:sensor histidine kinase [Hyphomicrobiales bacterium]